MVLKMAFVKKNVIMFADQSGKFLMHFSKVQMRLPSNE
jgi:hypothetical protein